MVSVPYELAPIGALNKIAQETLNLAPETITNDQLRSKFNQLLLRHHRRRLVRHRRRRRHDVAHPIAPSALVEA